MIASALATLGLLLLITWIWGSSFAPRAPRGRAARVRHPGPRRAGLADHAAGPDRGRACWVGRCGCTAIGLALTVALVAWRRPSLRPGRLSFTPIAVAVAATALVTFPGFFVTTPQLWPSHYDMLWHQGWIRQLAAGMSAPRGHLRRRAQLLPVALPLDLGLDPGDDAGQPERGPACGRRRRRPGRLARDLAARPRARGVVGSRDLGRRPAHGHRRLRLDLAARARGGSCARTASTSARTTAISCSTTCSTRRSATSPR